MKEYDEKKDHMIDMFYEEVSDSRIEELGNYKEFSKKLIDASKSLEVLESEKIDFYINTMEIIEQSQIIQNKSTSRRETILFTILSTVILYTYFSLAFIYSPNIILISQIILFMIVPLFIIPLSIQQRRGAKGNGK